MLHLVGKRQQHCLQTGGVTNHHYGQANTPQVSCSHFVMVRTATHGYIVLFSLKPCAPFCIVWCCRYGHKVHPKKPTVIFSNLPNIKDTKCFCKEKQHAVTVADMDSTKPGQVQSLQCMHCSACAFQGDLHELEAGNAAVQTAIGAGAAARRSNAGAAAGAESSQQAAERAAKNAAPQHNQTVAAEAETQKRAAEKDKRANNKKTEKQETARAVWPEGFIVRTIWLCAQYMRNCNGNIADIRRPKGAPRHDMEAGS